MSQYVKSLSASFILKVYINYFSHEMEPCTDRTDAKGVSITDQTVVFTSHSHLVSSDVNILSYAQLQVPFSITA